MTAHHHDDWFIQLRSKSDLGSDTVKSFTLGTVLKGVQIGRKSAEARHEVESGLYVSPVISREHAMISVNAISGSITLTDDTSRHGTYINGLQIRRPVFIKQNDIISFGKSISKGSESHNPIVVQVDVNSEIAFPLKAETKGRYGVSQEFLEDDGSVREISPAQEERARLGTSQESLEDGESVRELSPAYEEHGSSPGQDRSDAESVASSGYHDHWNASEREDSQHADSMRAESVREESVPLVPETKPQEDVPAAQPVDPIRNIDFTPSIDDYAETQIPQVAEVDDDDCSSCGEESDGSGHSDSERSDSYDSTSESEVQEEDEAEADEEHFEDDKENVAILVQTSYSKVLQSGDHRKAASLSLQPAESVRATSVVPETDERIEADSLPSLILPASSQIEAEPRAPRQLPQQAVHDIDSFETAAVSYLAYMMEAEFLIARLIGIEDLCEDLRERFVKTFAEDESTTPERIVDIVNQVEMALIDEKYLHDEASKSLLIVHEWRDKLSLDHGMICQAGSSCMSDAGRCTNLINKCISILNIARRHKQGAKIREAKFREAKLREAQESIIPETLDTQSLEEPMPSVDIDVHTEHVDEIKIDAVEAPTTLLTPPPEASVIQSLAASAGMATPPRPLKRSLTETDLSVAPPTPATPERPVKRARSVKTALSAFVIGSVIGSASTIAGLLQYAD